MSSSLRSPSIEISPRRSRPGTASQGWLLLLAGCLPVLGAVLLAPVLPAIAREFAGTPGVGTLVPLIVTAPALVIAVGAPFVGYLTDRVGRKRALVAALFLYSLTGMAPLFFDSLTLIVVSRLLLGAAEAVIMTAVTTLMGDYFSGKRRSHYMSLLTVSTTISATIFLLVGGLLGTAGWRAPFWLYGVGIVFGLIAMKQLHEPLASPAKRIWRNVPWRQLAVPLTFTFIGGAVFYTLIVQLPFILESLNVTDADRVGMLSAVASAATAAGALSYRFLDHFSPAVKLTLAFGMAGSGFVLVWVAESLFLTMAGAVIASAGTGLSVPTLMIWTIGRLEQKVRGTGTGVWTSVNWLGQFASPIIVGTTVAIGGGLATGIGYFGVLIVAIALGWALTVITGRSPLIQRREDAVATPQG